MVPGYSNGFEQGVKMPSDGTARDGHCVICNERFSHRYYLGVRGPYCALHFPQDSRPLPGGTP